MFRPEHGETSVARFVQRREVQRVLVPQLVGHFGVRGFQRIECQRLVETSARRARELGQVLFTLIERLQSEPQPIDHHLIEFDRSFAAVQQRVQFGSFRSS